MKTNRISDKDWTFENDTTPIVGGMTNEALESLKKKGFRIYELPPGSEILPAIKYGDNLDVVDGKLVKRVKK